MSIQVDIATAWKVKHGENLVVRVHLSMHNYLDGESRKLTEWEGGSCGWEGSTCGWEGSTCGWEGGTCGWEGSTCALPLPLLHFQP